MNLDAHFPALLEKAIDWVSDLEAHVLEEGVELTPDQLIDARLAGVSQPARIRLLVSRRMPMPEDSLLAEANRQVRLVSPDAGGLTVGYGIILRAGYEHQRRLLVHELVHVGQYERLGGLDGFVRQYLVEITSQGYDNAPLEREAETRAEAIAGMR